MEEFAQSDSVVWQQLQAGDDAALEEILRRYQTPVLNFVHRLLGNGPEAEDVAQEVFVRVYQRRADYDPAQKFSTWLFTVARNAAIDRLRWRKRHPTEPLDQSPLPSPTPSAASEAQSRELGEQIATAIGALPEEQRTAIILSEYHGLPDAEIAAVMKCSPKSVELRLYRAKQALRKRLQHLLD